MKINCKYNIGDLVIIEFENNFCIKTKLKGEIEKIEVNNSGFIYHIKNTVNIETGELTGSITVNESNILGLRKTPKLNEKQINTLQLLSDKGYMIKLWYDEVNEKFRIEGCYDSEDSKSTVYGDL